jgi:hypothetical protein
LTKKPRYEPRVFDGRIIQSAEIERIHKGILDAQAHGGQFQPSTLEAIH